ncbi:MAG: CRISPR system precrRNA processing endoribonuclease RAMP protein Cas6 [bacterium]|nr:CRISPR system precrRNA processing endoribonuclease RAMP protein Cas6 [bacterium]
MAKCELGIFDLKLNAITELHLPPYKGSTLRGGFGHAFKSIVCSSPDKCRDACIQKDKCPYGYIFETPVPADSERMRKYPYAPHPFIIEPPPEKKTIYQPDETLSFRLILIGKAIGYLPYFIFTFEELGKIGIGKDRGKYQVVTVENITESNQPVIIYSGSDRVVKNTYQPIHIEVGAMLTANPCESRGIPAQTGIQSPLGVIPAQAGIHIPPVVIPAQAGIHIPPEVIPAKAGIHIPPEVIPAKAGIHKQVTIYFLTPTRLKYETQLATDLEFHIFFRNLLRRISSLLYFHCETDLGKELDFKQLIEQAKQIQTIQKDLRWYDWERYSARQETKMNFGGLIGQATFTGNLAPFLPYLKLGEYIHVGKGTSFGLGKYRMVCSF